MAPVDSSDRMRDKEDRVHERGLYFLISNAPGPFRLISEEVKWYEQHGNRFVAELTIKPVESGQELLGHDRPFKIPFEVVLKGATTSTGHGVDQPRNVRFLGKFVITSDVQSGYFPYVDPKAASVLDEYQWEAVFNPEDRKGMVFRLKQPLPWEWTL